MIHRLRGIFRSQNQSRRRATHQNCLIPQPRATQSLESRVLPAVIVVTSLADDNVVDGSVTLREAIQAANLNISVDGSNAGDGADKIVFAPGLGGRIDMLLGQFVITESVAIQGNEVLGIEVAGGRKSRIFDVRSTVQNVTFADLTISYGKAVKSDPDGSGIRSMASGSLSLTDCTLYENRGEGNGGAIYSSSGRVVISQSTLFGNSATNRGGAVFSETGPVQVSQSTISRNSATSNCGGICLFGGIGDLTVQNTIIAANSSDGTSKDVFFANAPLNRVSIAYSLIGSNAGTKLNSTGSAIPNLDGSFIGGATADLYIDPKLGPLRLNGGPMMTVALLPGSIAINRGSNAFAVNPADGGTLLKSDQRGSPIQRISDSTVDMGAYELYSIGTPIVVSTNTDELDTDITTGDLSLREAITLANGSVGSNSLIFSKDTDNIPLKTLSGQMLISDSLTIVGNGSNRTIIDGQQMSRLVEIRDPETAVSAGDVSFRGMTFQNGRSLDQSVNGGGGAIRSLTLGTMTIGDCTFLNNSTTGIWSEGGAIWAGYGRLTIEGSVFSGNSTRGNLANGGAISSRGDTILSNSTVMGNDTLGANANGGGVYHLAFDGQTLTINQCTVSGNVVHGRDSRGGGGLYADYGKLIVSQSTVTGNSVSEGSGRGGGIFGYEEPGRLTELRVVNSIIAENIANTLGSSRSPNDIGGGWSKFAVASSLVGTPFSTLLPASQTGDANGNFVGVKAHLGPIGDNGGTVPTHSPLPGSLARNHGSNSLAIDLASSAQNQLVNDQRGQGFPRIVGPSVDIGAVEAPDDGSGITVSVLDALTSEAGETGSFSIKLNTNPNGTLVINLTSSDLSEGKLSASTATFNSDNWNLPQTFLVTGVDDSIIDGDVAFQVVTSPAIGSDYDGYDPADVSFTNLDNDSVVIPAGFSLSRTTAVVSEDGKTAVDSFSVVLTAQPATDVVLSLSRSANPDAELSQSVLTFSRANWNVPQSVNITGLDDWVDDGDEITTVTISVVDSASDNAFDLLPDQTVTITTKDDDTAGFVLNKSAATVSEDGTSIVDSFTVVLTSQPLSDVVVDFSLSANPDVALDKSSLTFTSLNWNTPQAVRISGLNDTVADGDEFTTIKASVNDAASDNSFDPVADKTVIVTTTDDDKPSTPDVDVRVAGVPIQNGVGVINFGVATQFSPVGSKTVQVRNTGLTPLILQPASITSGSGFNILSNFAAGLTLLSDQTADLVLEFSTDAVGSKTAVIQFTSNTLAKSPFVFSATGIVTAAPISVSIQPNAQPSFSWTAVPGATSYEIWVTRDPSSNPYHTATVNTNSYVAPVDFGIGKFNVWVRAKKGTAGTAWTPKQSFVITTPPRLNPVQRIQNTLRPAIAWAELKGADRYDIWINDVTRGIQQVVRDTNVKTNAMNPAIDLPLGLYRVWVRGGAADGTFSSWSSALEFQTAMAPGLSYPAMASTFDRTPTFRWQAVAGATSYEFFLRDQNTGATVLNPRTVNGVSFTPTTALPDGPYRWWVRANGPQNVTSNWTAPYDIYIGGRTSLLAPTGQSGIVHLSLSGKPSKELRDMISSSIRSAGYLRSSASKACQFTLFQLKRHCLQATTVSGFVRSAAPAKLGSGVQSSSLPSLKTMKDKV